MQLVIAGQRCNLRLGVLFRLRFRKRNLARPWSASYGSDFDTEFSSYAFLTYFFLFSGSRLLFNSGLLLQKCEFVFSTPFIEWIVNNHYMHART